MIKNVNLDEQLIKLGYFSEHIPPCFSSNKLYDNYEKLKSSCQNKHSESLSITIAKNDEHRRTIKIPNPEQQLKLFSYILDNIDEIDKRISVNKHTLANPIGKLEFYDEMHFWSFFDIPTLKDRDKIGTNYLQNLGKKMRVSMGYRFLYKLDLANFYDSIYTHSIEWAIIGKEKTKENLANRSREKNLGGKLDKLVACTNNNETAGIPTGPFSSRIISELLLNKIDEDLEKLTDSEKVKFEFVHYVDDYEFYFRNEADYKKIIQKIRKVFEYYRLRINENKSQFYSLPFYNERDLKEQFSFFIRKFKNEDAHDARLLFFKADELTMKGEKGAYKYLYKQLEKEDLSFSWNEIEPILISHLLIKPALAQYIIKIILKHSRLISGQFKEELKYNLFFSVQNQLDNEAQWLFWIIRKLGIKLNANELSELLKDTQDDLMRIMVIDTAKQYKKIETQTFKNAMDLVMKELLNSNLRSERWLLIYEWHFNKWSMYEKLDGKIQEIAFFKALKNKNVNFYSF
jgi:hypothetical protein